MRSEAEKPIFTAGEEVSALRHAYCCCYLQAGEVVVADQLDPGPSPTDDPHALEDG